jgi:hypothetical protein
MTDHKPDQSNTKIANFGDVMMSAYREMLDTLRVQRERTGDVALSAVISRGKRVNAPPLRKSASASEQTTKATEGAGLS